jgi:3,4-dihydroxy 2-butanone 4-phosphate synthase/GTP cyclohydrolase II
MDRPGHIFQLPNREVFLEEQVIRSSNWFCPISRFQVGRVIVEIMNEDGSMARLPQLAEVAKNSI